MWTDERKDNLFCRGCIAPSHGLLCANDDDVAHLLNTFPQHSSRVFLSLSNEECKDMMLTTITIYRLENDSFFDAKVSL